MRRLLTTLLLGGLSLALAAGQASALAFSEDAYATARGAALRAAEIAQDNLTEWEGGTVSNPGLAEARNVLVQLAVDKGLLDAVEDGEAVEGGKGLLNAIAVHNALLEGELPSTVAGGKGIEAIAEAYKGLRGLAKGQENKPDKPDKPEKPEKPEQAKNGD